MEGGVHSCFARSATACCLGEKFAPRNSFTLLEPPLPARPLGRLQRIFERGKDVLAFQVRVVVQQLVDAGANGELTEHRADGDAGVADHPVRVDGDSLLAMGQGASPSAHYRCRGTNARRIAVNRCASGSFQALIRSSA